jgi:hypothetical protein
MKPNLVAASLLLSAFSCGSSQPAGKEAMGLVRARCELVEVGTPAAEVSDRYEPRWDECVGSCIIDGGRLERIPIADDVKRYRVGLVASWNVETQIFPERDVGTCCIWVTDGGVAAKAVCEVHLR